MKFARFAFTIVIPLQLVIVAVMVLFLSGEKETAWLVSYMGTTLVVLFAACYVMFFDSRRRWPDVRFEERLDAIASLKVKRMDEEVSKKAHK